MAAIKRAALIADYVLSDVDDLRWMAWAMTLEPRAQLLMQRLRPEGHCRSVEFREISACFAHDAFGAVASEPSHWLAAAG